MKSKYEIVAELANNKLVEKMVCNIAHQSLSEDLKDLAQMVYIILLEYDDDRIIDLYTNKQMHFFIARIIINQFRSSNSPYHLIFRRYQESFVSINNLDDGDGFYPQDKTTLGVNWDE